MATQIDSIIRLRRGPDSERQTTVLSSGEIAYSTDIGRMFIGDGANAGGNVAGNRVFYGATPSISAVPYDMFFKTTTSEFFMLTGGGGDNIGNYIHITYALGTGFSVTSSGISIDTNNLGYVKLSGDSMTGSLSTRGLTASDYSTFRAITDHSNKRITNVANPVDQGDAVNKQTVDSSMWTLSSNLVSMIQGLSANLNSVFAIITAGYVKKAGDTMSGQLTIQNQLSVTGNIISNSDVIGFY